MEVPTREFGTRIGEANFKITLEVDDSSGFSNVQLLLSCYLILEPFSQEGIIGRIWLTPLLNSQSPEQLVQRILVTY